MKVIEDTLKINNKYSLKRVISAITFCFIILLGSFIGISDFILAKEVSSNPFMVFSSLLVFLGANIGISEFSKKFENKQEPVIEE